MRSHCVVLAAVTLSACGGSSGPPGGGQPVDRGRAADGPRTARSADTRTLLTATPWQMVGMEDSGGPYEAGKDGPVFVFTPDGTLYRGCDRERGSPYQLADDTIVVQMGSSELRWRIVELTPERFVFGEGADLFHHEPTRCAP